MIETVIRLTCDGCGFVRNLSTVSIPLTFTPPGNWSVCGDGFNKHYCPSCTPKYNPPKEACDAVTPTEAKLVEALKRLHAPHLTAHERGVIVKAVRIVEPEFGISKE